MMSKTWGDLAKSISGNKISNYKTFGTTGSTVIFSREEEGLQVKICIT